MLTIDIRARERSIAIGRQKSGVEKEAVRDSCTCAVDVCEVRVPLIDTKSAQAKKKTREKKSEASAQPRVEM